MNKMKIFALAELILLITIVALDVLIPSLIIILVGVTFVLIRKEKPALFEKKVWKQPVIFLAKMFMLGIALSVFDYCIVIPLLNHMTHTTQSMNVFAELKGNEVLLGILLAYSWVVAAIGEEFAYRGFFQNRIISLFSNRTVGIIVATIGTSALFGIMHLEQGVVGVVNTALDAVILSVIRYRMRNIWASVLVHGFSNMIGIVTFYFTGPLYGLW